eukprot:5798126-Prymnesium_polylepis.1
MRLLATSPNLIARWHQRVARRSAEREPAREHDAAAGADCSDSMQMLKARGEEDAPPTSRLDDLVPRLVHEGKLTALEGLPSRVQVEHHTIVVARHVRTVHVRSPGVVFVAPPRLLSAACARRSRRLVSSQHRPGEEERSHLVKLGGHPLL